jgi:hypothetical protein
MIDILNMELLQLSMDVSLACQSTAGWKWFDPAATSDTFVTNESSVCVSKGNTFHASIERLRMSQRTGTGNRTSVGLSSTTAGVASLTRIVAGSARSA